MRPLLKSKGWQRHCLFLSMLLVATIVSAQPPERSIPQTVPDLLKEVEQVMERQRIPGLMLAIVTKDSVLFAGGLGYSNVEAGRKVDGQQKFRLGSTTKMMVAMGILHMVHTGKISLDAKLADVAPEIPFHNRWEETHPVRIINLLEHTSGFIDAFLNKTINLGPTDRQGLDVLKYYKSQLETQFKPGTMPAYTNTNYTVLGYVIEAVTGKTWTAYLQENVLLPIGMTHTDFNLRLPDNGQYAQGYYTRAGQQIPVPDNFTLNSNGAHGSMNSCAEDMAKLTQFFLNDWRVDTMQWLPVSYLDQMENVNTTLASQHGLRNGYGLGNHIETWHPKATFHGHGGTIQGFMAHMIYDRQRGIGVALAKNGGYNDAPIAMLVTDFLTRDMPVIEPVDKELSIDSIQPYLGYYRPVAIDEHFGFIRNIVRDVNVGMNGGQLAITPLRGWTIPLSHTGDLKFRISFEHDPVYAFAQTEQGEKIMMSATPRGGAHFIKTSFASVMTKRFLAALGVLALFIGMLIGILSIIAVMVRKLPVRKLPMRVLPMLAVLSLAIGLKPLIQAAMNTLSFTEPNGVTLTIFFGTLFFGLFALMSVGFLYARWDELTSRWMKVMMAFSVAGIFIVACVFLVNGMIAPMIWRW